TGKELWRHAETESENLGWDLILAGDQDGDGYGDLFVGAPSGDSGRVYLLSGKDGSVLRTYSPREGAGSFGWYVARLDDLDGDGRPDLAVGAPFAADTDGAKVGGAWALSSASGRELYHWKGTDRRGGVGGVVAAAGDLAAIGAPWHRRGTADRVGRVELRSGRSGKVLDEFFGDEADCWFGWHIRRAPDPDGRGRPALLISSLRHPVDGKVGVGVLDLYVLR